MKKIKLSIAGLMLCGLSYSQSVDTLAFMVAGKQQIEFDYYSSKVINRIITKDFEDFALEIKENEVIYIDLFDDCTCNEYQDLEKIRIVTVYLTDYHSWFYGMEKVLTFEYKSNDKTLIFNGEEVEKVVIHKLNTTIER